VFSSTVKRLRQKVVMEMTLDTSTLLSGMFNLFSYNKITNVVYIRERFKKKD